MELGKYSFGTGDRFSMQGEAQLRAFQMAFDRGIEVTPVWNKSNREHITIGSEPCQTRAEADAAVKALDWDRPYFVDADHINLDTVDRFIDASDFFTIDVADHIGKPVGKKEIEAFVSANSKYAGTFNIPGVAESFEISTDDLRDIANRFLYAVKQAAGIYRYITEKKGGVGFVTEVSMDEVSEAQSPIELFFILSALSAEGVPADTIAPKFTGRFNKGVDYVGDVSLFEKEFEQDLLVLDYAVKEFGFPAGLKLSVHSGSDKLSIYPVMGRLIRKYDKGIHIKTAGTTWLEEAIGLAMAGGEATALVRDFYFRALDRFDELASPYASVIDIDREALPARDVVMRWEGDRLAAALRHVPGHPQYNLHFRQLMHVAYKLAAEAGERYLSLLVKHKELVGRQVTENIFDRHIKRLFEL